MLDDVELDELLSVEVLLEVDVDELLEELLELLSELSVVEEVVDGDEDDVEVEVRRRHLAPGLDEHLPLLQYRSEPEHLLTLPDWQSYTSLQPRQLEPRLLHDARWDVLPCR